jgi:hypothetical protein
MPGPIGAGTRRVPSTWPRIAIPTHRLSQEGLVLILVLDLAGGCVRAHPTDVAPEPASELYPRLRAFKLHYGRCDRKLFR